MSWSINLIGKKANVAACVKAQLVDNLCAQTVGLLIIDRIAAVPDCAPSSASPSWGCDSVRVVGYGHGGSIGRLEIELFCEAVAPQVSLPVPVPGSIDVEPSKEISPTASAPDTQEAPATSAPDHRINV